MPAKFNAAEVFEIGIEIEKNGKEFYREAAQRAREEGVRKLFSDLAEWETQHVATFQKLKDSLRGKAQASAVYDSYDEVSLYIKAAADSHIFLKNGDARKLAADCPHSIDALKMALSFEKDSVVLYRAMEEMVPEELGQADVGRLVLEELKHISILNAEMAKLTSE